MLRLNFSLFTACLAASPCFAQIDSFDREPINYKFAEADNVVTALQKRVNAGQTKLKFVDDHGYLPSILKELNVPQSSQVLVFSKTSFQRERIAPKTPRALYFNDDVYVGFCLRGDVLEFSAVDNKLGTSFYTLDQEPEADGKVNFLRQKDNCLVCHASTATGGAPGHLVRSVFPDRSGMPILSAGSYRIDHSSPFAERWGGWYVTGTHGKQTHMGNWVVENKKDPTVESNAAGQNVTELKSRFTVANYLTPHSDIVALLVFEHQTQAHNRIAQALITNRQALHYQETLNKELNEQPGHKWESVQRRIESSGDALAKYLLFSGEAKLEGPVEGTSEFAKEFAARGPFDKQGRSLRQFDLKTRLFKYPCSYLIYSPAFDGLPASVQERAYQRLWDVLTGKDTGKDYDHLSAGDRQAIKEILIATKPGLPTYWK
jgi:hypothetical protein